MNFNRTWFIVAYLLLMLAFGGLAIYSFTQFSAGIRTLPSETRQPVQIQRQTEQKQEVEGVSMHTLPDITREPVQLLFAGDVMLSRYVDTVTQRAGSPHFPWELVAEETQRAALFFINLEAPFSETGPYDDENLIFAVRPEYVEGLTFAGVDVVSFANNHYRDSGADAIALTKSLLSANGIAHAFPGEPALLTVGGFRIGVTADAYNLGLDEEQLRQDIAALAEQGADFIVTSMHAGAEYVQTQGAAQEQYARTAINAGADLVVGHHPHVVQPTEEYNGGFIAYSLGNFIFDQFFSEETQRGQVLEVTLSEEGATFATQDISINSRTQPSIIK